ncbi:unnamed protein product [Brachionus calyciflorus]|uniref:Uncharacterized protein n=1 Tax=Brachionus calyciflorus TaxID=104777 RepID=A0A813PZ71_9BILA|nr:unnamed protein product [Brachionus calyciflorus]
MFDKEQILGLDKSDKRTIWEDEVVYPTVLNNQKYYLVPIIANPVSLDQTLINLDQTEIIKLEEEKEEQENSKIIGTQTEEKYFIDIKQPEWNADKNEIPFYKMKKRLCLLYALQLFLIILFVIGIGVTYSYIRMRNPFENLFDSSNNKYSLDGTIVQEHFTYSNSTIFLTISPFF